jgi:hypothetical protein
MKIIDNNGLNYVVDNRIKLNENFCTTPDVQEEFEVKYDGGLPKNVQNVWEDLQFDKAGYLKNYADMLNKYGDKSFYNMRGFGDISILALLKTVKQTHKVQLPGLEDGLLVITTDGQLTKHIAREFGDKSELFDVNIQVVDYAAYFAT